MRVSADGHQWTQEELAKEKMLHCLDCDKHFSERHVGWPVTFSAEIPRISMET